MKKNKKRAGIEEVDIEEIYNGDSKEDKDEDLDIVDTINKELESYGADSDQYKFYLLKLNENNKKYEHCETFNSIDNFDIIEVGKRYGGGSYLLKAYVNGEFKKSKTFSLSKIAFPEPIPKNIIDDNNIDNTLKILMDTQNKNQETMIRLISEIVNKKDDGLDKVIKGIEIANNMNKNTDIGQISEIVTNAFNSGINLAIKSIENKNTENIGDIIKDSIKDILSNVDLSSVLKPKVVKSDNQLNQNNNSNILESILTNIVVGYNKKIDVEYFVDLIINIDLYKGIYEFIKNYNTDNIIQILSNTDFVTYLNDSNFKEYFVSIINKIKEKE